MDVALYFIAPHRLRPVDIDFITRLSEIVPVVRHTYGACGSQASSGCCRRLGRAALASSPVAYSLISDNVLSALYNCLGLLLTHHIQAEVFGGTQEAC